MTCHDLYPRDTLTAVGPRHEAGRVLVGVDGSPASVVALRWAARQAQCSGARLEVALVFAPAPAMFFAVGGYPAVSPVDAIAARKQAQRLLEETVGNALGATTDVHMLGVADSSPAKALTRLAQGADMLVVGAHRHTALGLLLGSTAAACVRHAVCPVVVVPASDEEPVEPVRSPR